MYLVSVCQEWSADPAVFVLRTNDKEALMLNILRFAIERCGPDSIAVADSLNDLRLIPNGRFDELCVALDKLPVINSHFQMAHGAAFDADQVLSLLETRFSITAQSILKAAKPDNEFIRMFGLLYEIVNVDDIQEV